VDWERRRALLDAVRDGTAEPSPDVEKLTLIVRALELRRRRPEPFAGDYVPLGAGPDCIAFVRGGAVLAVATIRESGEQASIAAAGRWREVVGDAEHDLSDGVLASQLTAGRGYALLERV
jgi:maltooligosyltrehalose synthase